MLKSMPSALKPPLLLPFEPSVPLVPQRLLAYVHLMRGDYTVAYLRFRLRVLLISDVAFLRLDTMEGGMRFPVFVFGLVGDEVVGVEVVAEVGLDQLCFFDLLHLVSQFCCFIFG